MGTQCVSAIKGRVFRVVKLNECGAPVTGAGSAQAVFENFIKIDYSFDYEEGEEFTNKLANGRLCVNQKDAAQLKRVGLSIEMCVFDWELLELMTGQRLLTTSVGASGAGLGIGEEPLTNRWSLEVWQDIAGDAACDPSGDPQYVYWGIPNVGNAKLGNYSVANAPGLLTVTAETRRANLLWGSGVGGTSWLDGNVVATGEHMLPFVTTTPPPAATCGAVLLS